MFPVNEWHDWLRVTSIVIASVTVVLLTHVWKHESGWGQSEKDIWYVLLMWALTTIVICLDGLYNDLPFGPRSVFVMAASTVTLTMLIRRLKRDNAKLQ